jgi:AraC-like DNA-binding protein
MNTNLTSILFALLIFQLLFLSIFLFTRTQGKRISNVLLGLFFLFIFLNLLDLFFLQLGIYAHFPQLAGWGSCLPLVFGPFIFLYTRSVVYQEFRISRKELLHFLPGVVFLAGTEYFYLSQPVALQMKLLSDLGQHHFPKTVILFSSLIFLQFLGYAVASLRLVFLYKKASGQYFSDERHTDIRWLYTTLIFFMGVILISGFNGIFAETSGAKYYLLFFNLIVLVMLVYILRLLFHALHRPFFFPLSEEQVRVSRPLPKAIRPSPENAEADKILQLVLTHMHSQKPYLEPELTLDQLANQLSLKPRTLSQVINKLKGQNFFDFINHYRIEEASRLLTHPKDPKITVLEILYQVGFNSKSSFNTLFKKYTGLTPSEFKKKNLR